MRPICFTRTGDITTFHYSFSDLRWYITQGKKSGDVGHILMSRDHKSRITTYKGFGTIENSIVHLTTLSIVHLESFDGSWLEDEAYFRIWSKPQTVKESYGKVVIIDFSEPDDPNI